MIIDKSTHSYLLECMYDKTTHMKYYGQFPVGIRFHLGIIDKDYSELGAKIFKDENEILNSSDIIVQLGMLSEEKGSLIKENQIFEEIFLKYFFFII